MCCWSKFLTSAAPSPETSRRAAFLHRRMAHNCTAFGAVSGLAQGRLPRGDLRAPLPLSEIRNSSSVCPDCSAAAIHRGCLPRPDHVSVGDDGLEYFGKTFAYFRRGRPVGGAAEEFASICSVGFNCARRFSSSSFSAVIFSERILVSSSCKSHSSSKSIDCRSSLPIALSSLINLQSGGPPQTGKSLVPPADKSKVPTNRTLDYILN